MKDRISLNPGRVLVTPEDGGAAYYATLTRADNPQQEGDALNKNTLLKDSTAEALGLSDAALPDDALRILSRLHAGLGNEYLWSVTARAATIIQGAETTYGGTLGESMQYSATVQISGSSIVLVNPVTFTSGDEINTAVIGKYLQTAAGQIYYCVNITSAGSGQPVTYTVKTLSVAQPGIIGYVNSPNPNAYPPAEDDGYTYTALGMLGGAARIATGSYVGTGTYGSANKNMLTLDVVPRFVVVFTGYPSGGGQAISGPAFMIHGANGISYAAGSGRQYPYGLTVTWDDLNKTVAWYGNDANVQCNASGETYSYFVAS